MELNLPAPGAEFVRHPQLCRSFGGGGAAHRLDLDGSSSRSENIWIHASTLPRLLLGRVGGAQALELGTSVGVGYIGERSAGRMSNGCGVVVQRLYLSPTRGVGCGPWSGIAVGAGCRVQRPRRVRVVAGGGTDVGAGAIGWSPVHR